MEALGVKRTDILPMLVVCVELHNASYLLNRFHECFIRELLIIDCKRREPKRLGWISNSTEESGNISSIRDCEYISCARCDGLCWSTRPL